MSKGVIYILTNPSFPEYIKIGYASDIEKRLKQLNRSETLPYAFRVYAVYEVDNKLTDREIHRLIDTLNPELRAIEIFDGKERVKEFYAMSPEDAYLLFDCIAKISGTENQLKKLTPEGHQVLDENAAEEIRNESKKPPFKFSEYGIEVGEELTFVDDPGIVVKVLDERHIEYNGQKYAMSTLAQELKKTSYPCQGTVYFKYKGKKLVDIRKEIDKN